MANEDSPNTSPIFLTTKDHLQNGDTLAPSPSLSLMKPRNNDGKWTLRNSVSSASFRRYRSPFHRSAGNTASVNPQYSPSPSFPLFRRFYLMRPSLKRRRTRDIPTNMSKAYAIDSNEKLSSSLRIEISHVLTTIFITIAGACLLVLMIYLDFLYMDDAFLTSIYTDTQNNTALCLRHPKVCVMKGLVIIVFIAITVTLCCTILTLYTRARSHSRLLERKTDELEKEKCLTEKLLHEILPPCVAKDLINGRKAPAEYYESVTVYFSDIVGFTIIASMCSPHETCDMLNCLYSIFDSLLENFDVYKVETIGDAYMVVSGAPTRNGDKHPNEIANMSLALLLSKQKVRVPRTGAELQLRIGIHTGPVCAAVIGSKMPRYCMFGDTVNVASRMESTGLPGKIHLSDDTYRRLIHREQFLFEDRGEIAVKGKGVMRTFFLLDRKPIQEAPRTRSNTLSKSEREFA